MSDIEMRFVRIGNYVFNPDRISYISQGEEDGSRVVFVYFNEGDDGGVMLYEAEADAMIKWLKQVTVNRSPKT